MRLTKLCRNVQNGMLGNVQAVFLEISRETACFFYFRPDFVLACVLVVFLV